MTRYNVHKPPHVLPMQTEMITSGSAALFTQTALLRTGSSDSIATEASDPNSIFPNDDGDAVVR